MNSSECETDYANIELFLIDAIEYYNNCIDKIPYFAGGAICDLETTHTLSLLLPGFPGIIASVRKTDGSIVDIYVRWF